MKIFGLVLLFISAIFFWGTMHFFWAFKKPGVYPPKQLLKKKAIFLAGAGGVFLLIGSIISYFKR